MLSRLAPSASGSICTSLSADILGNSQRFDCVVNAPRLVEHRGI